MKIVIEIPEERYRLYKFKAEHHVSDAQFDLHNIIAKGIPLPEHHGDLVDKGDILHDIDCDEEMRLGKNAEWVREVIRNAPTVIKATENTNKEESK